MFSKRQYVNYLVFVLVVYMILNTTHAMSKEDKRKLRDQAKDMFYHGYRNYMEHAYPHDELMPLSCKGRSRGTKPSRGDMDSLLGNFSLTLVDSFDTLVIIGDISEFENAARKVISDVTFDRDIVVSLFETNIRMLGGLLSGHVLATWLRDTSRGLPWYEDQLLEMAKDLGYRLLPAFNTTTGIPFPQVNLRHGVRKGIARAGHEKDTCTACAGTLLLEFAALSRLSGEPIFEEKAHRAMDSLWQYRHRSSNLVGTVINIHSGEWVRRDSGIGAGTDSYYEYLLKAYILLGDDTYLDRFNTHYESIMKYMSQGPLMVDVHMHKPHSNSRNFMDALFAFWPGLQILKGDIAPAIQIHEMLYQVMQRHNFLPEAFTTDFRVHWAQHPLRPEFIESTYFIYKATKDPHYLEVGKNVLENLKQHAQVSCGFAALKHVTTGEKEDQMDSFVLSETFKYLYLLFSEDEDLLINVDDYIFTTEAHLLPLALSLHESSSQRSNVTSSAGVLFMEAEPQRDNEVTCPNLANQGDELFTHRLRHPLKNLVEEACPKPNSKPGSSSSASSGRRRLRAAEFMAGNKQQVHQLRDMGIRIVTMSDGRIQLFHTASEAVSEEEAGHGLQFMQEMMELSRNQQQHHPAQDPHLVQLLSEPYYGNIVLQAGLAQFGLDLHEREGVKGNVVVADPMVSCGLVRNAELIAGRIAIAKRGECMFIDKARVLAKAGAVGAIVVDNTSGSSASTSQLFAMSGDGLNDVTIPMVFLFSREGDRLLESLEKHLDLVVYLTHTAKTVDEVLKDLLRDNGLIGGSRVTDLSVSIATQEEEEEEEKTGKRTKESHDTVIHRHIASSGDELFRVTRRTLDNSLELVVAKQAIQAESKKKLSTLLAKVVAMVQDSPEFTEMQLQEQSKSLYDLGKVMEAAVAADDVTRLNAIVRKILRHDLHIDLAEVTATGSNGAKVTIGSDTKSKILELFEMALDDYVEEQFEFAYCEARSFLREIGVDLLSESDNSVCERETETSGNSCESETKTSYASEEDLAEDDWVNWADENRIRIFKRDKTTLKASRPIYKAYDWMNLEDDEIYLDPTGSAFANDGTELFPKSAAKLPDLVLDIDQSCDNDYVGDAMIEETFDKTSPHTPSCVDADDESIYSEMEQAEEECEYSACKYLTTDGVEHDCSENIDFKDVVKISGNCDFECETSDDQLDLTQNENEDSQNILSKEETEHINLDESAYKVHEHSHETPDRVHGHSQETTDKVDEHSQETPDKVHAHSQETTDKVHEHSHETPDRVHAHSQETTDKVHAYPESESDVTPSKHTMDLDFRQQLVDQHHLDELAQLQDLLDELGQLEERQLQDPAANTDQLPDPVASTDQLQDSADNTKHLHTSSHAVVRTELEVLDDLTEKLNDINNRLLAKEKLLRQSIGRRQTKQELRDLTQNLLDNTNVLAQNEQEKQKHTSSDFDESAFETASDVNVAQNQNSASFSEEEQSNIQPSKKHSSGNL